MSAASWDQETIVSLAVFGLSLGAALVLVFTRRVSGIIRLPLALLFMGIAAMTVSIWPQPIMPAMLEPHRYAIAVFSAILLALSVVCMAAALRNYNRSMLREHELTEI